MGAARIAAPEVNCEGEDSSAGQVVVGYESVAVVAHLIRTTPVPQRTRVIGKLDTIRHSDRMFTLRMNDGQAVKGIAEGVTTEQLADLFGRQVVVTGVAVFRSSGAVLRIEADAIEPAGADAAVWARIPTPLFREVDSAALRQPQGPRSGVNAIMGHWPGEESEEAVAATLRELS
ncbi:MAG TPA: hypothetical protein VNI54_14585 [Thermoanaerobaculia bacterium]|nr:hypothetical protein [Thermoanaerobaculia bacterium]